MLSLTILIIALLYAVSSYILFRYPSLLYGSPKRKKYHRHISHRGGAAEHLENTMTAFDNAAKIGTDMFELDVHLTRDGQVVVVHDGHLLRLTGEDLKVADLCYHELPCLLSTQRLDFDHSFEVLSKSQDRNILLLEDLFKRYPSTPMNIDIKVNIDALIHKVEALIRKYGRESITIWGSGDVKINKKVKVANPNIGTLCSLHDMLKILALYLTGLLPFVTLEESHFEVPLCQVFLDNAKTFPGRAGSFKLRCILRTLDYVLTNPKLIKHLYKRGIPTYFFVLNTEAEWLTAARVGAAGIMTDFPTELRKWIDANQHEFVSDRF